MSPPGFVNIVVPIDDDHYVAAEDVQEDLAREICRCYNLVQSQDFSEAAQTFFRKEADVPSHGENRPRIFRRGNRVRTRGRDWLTGTFDSIDPETGAAVVAWDAPGGPRLSLLTELYPIKDRWETLEIGGED